MRALALVLAVGAVGCGSRDRVLLTLQGDLTDAVTLDLILVEPFGRERQQRVDEGVDGVFYVAQRDAVHYTLDAPPAPGAAFEIQVDVPTREPFLPIVVARALDGRIIAMGAYRADQIFIDGATPSAELLADVTKYDVVMEPTSLPPPDSVGIAPGQTISVTCADGLQSGIAWRRAAGDGRQLRIVLPDGVDPDGSAVARMEAGVDLDCDGHVAALQNDCDDIDAATRPGVAEVCDGRDNNCDGKLAGPQQVAGSCAAPPGCPEIALCDEARGDMAGTCVDTQRGCDGTFVCDVPAHAIDELTVKACDAQGVLEGSNSQFDPCRNGCRVTLVAAPADWTIEIGDPGDPDHRLFEPYELDPDRGLGIETKNGDAHPATTDDAGRFTLYIEPVVAIPPFLITFRLDLSTTRPNDCNNAPPLQCGVRVQPLR